jgi:hypothetical protein
MVSLDGVMLAPGGPQEDPTGGFAFGGWTFNNWDEVMGRSMNGLDGKDRELVLGRTGPTRSSRPTGRTSRPTTRLRRRSTRPASTWPRAR